MKRLRKRFGKNRSETSELGEQSVNAGTDLETTQQQTNTRRIWKSFVNVWTTYKFYVYCSLGIIIFVLYNVYLSFAITYKVNWEVTWCHGIRAVLIITIIVYGFLFYYKVIKVLIGHYIWQKFNDYGGQNLWQKIFKYPIIHLMWFTGLTTYAFVISVSTTQTFISYAGIWILLLLAFVFSKHHAKIHWRQVCWGLNLQFVIALLALHFQFPTQIYYCISDKSKWIGEQVDSGADFVFGYLISGNLKSSTEIPLGKQKPIMAFQMFSDMLIFSMIVGILHQCKISNAIINYIGRSSYFVFGSYFIESTVAVSAIFFGFKESVMFIRHYVPYISSAELYSISTLGMATESGALYGSFRPESKHTIHKFLGDILSIPSTLTMTRLLYPEVDDSTLKEVDIDYVTKNVAVYNNLGESIVKYIFDAMRLSGGIVATGIIFAIFPYLLNDNVQWLARMAGLKLDFIWLLSNVLTPIVYIVGIEWNESFNVAKAVATKLLFQQEYGHRVLNESKLSMRSRALGHYLLNDTANIIHLAFNIATISILVPSRLTDFVNILARAFFTALAATWLTTCIIGCMMTFSNFKEPFELEVP